jgi:hypothetical protein
MQFSRFTKDKDRIMRLGLDHMRSSPPLLSKKSDKKK